MSNVEPIPANSSVVIPMLVCRDVAAEIDFCKATFGTGELGNRPGPDGTTAHAPMTIYGTMIIIEAEWPTIASRAPFPKRDLSSGDLCLCRECGRGSRAYGQCRSTDSPPHKESILGRPNCQDYRSSGTRVDNCHAH